MKHAIQRLLNRAGYHLESRYPRDFSPELIEVIERVAPYTLTSHYGVAATCAAAEHVARYEVPGAIVECGAWKGGSMMAVALTLLRLGAGDRELYLFDTFSGMSEPTDADIRADGLRAVDVYRKTRDDELNEWCGVPVGEVRAALASTGYDLSRVQFVQGRVEDTLPEQAPQTISLLRLDTDWYESTKHELIHLFPRLVPGGILLLDDYGHWLGARRAADEYFAEADIRLFLARVDYTGRVAVKEAS